MPLITCPECGKQISDKSEFCVGCGCPASAFATLTVSSEVEVCIEDGVLRYVEDPENELTTFTIPQGVTTIERGALAELQIKSVVIPEGVTTIGADAFASTLIEELVLPKSLEEVRFKAFGEMPHLKKVTFLGLPKKWDSDLFAISNFEDDDLAGILTVELPEGMTEIPEMLFMNAGTLISVKIPKSVKKIGKCAFTECTNLSSIQLPEGIEEIGALAFSECTSLKSVVLPKTLQRIGPGIFENCSALTSVKLSGDAWSARYAEDGSFEFEFDGAEYGERMDISEDELSNAELMARYFVHNFVEYEFERGLPAMESTSVVAEVCDVEQYDSSEFLIENKVLKKFIGQQKYITVPRGVVRIESFAFAGVEAGTVILPNTVTSIGDHAFYGATSSGIELCEGLTSIGEEAFANCKELRNLRIPSSVEFIGEGAFIGCPKLSQLVFVKSNGWLYSTVRLSEKKTAIPLTKISEASTNPAAFLTTYGQYYLEKKR